VLILLLAIMPKKLQPGFRNNFNAQRDLCLKPVAVVITYNNLVFALPVCNVLP
jgi:hypothetical protein